MSRSIWSLAFLLLLFSFQAPTFAQNTLPYRDADFPCLNEAAANRYIRDFNINVRSFGGVELCNPLDLR